MAKTLLQEQIEQAKSDWSDVNIANMKLVEKAQFGTVDYESLDFWPGVDGLRVRVDVDGWDWEDGIPWTSLDEAAVRKLRDYLSTLLEPAEEA